MEFEELWLRHVLERVKETHGDEIKEALGVDISVPHLPFPKIPMAEAQDILARTGHVPPEQTKTGDLDLKANDCCASTP